MRPAWSPIIVLALGFASLAWQCGAPAEEVEVTREAEEVLREDETTVPREAATEVTAEAPPTAPTEESTEEPGDGDGVGRATLSIGDNTWSFDRVDFCAMSPPEDETESFILIAQQDGVQLVAEINDPTGERRLEGEGVWGSIQLVEPPRIVEGYEVFPGWFASSEASGEQFIVVDGLSVTASAKFDDFAGEFEQIPGTLQATCP